MKKALVIGVILLFLGVFFQPVLANEEKTTNDKSTIKEDFNIPPDIEHFFICLICGTYNTRYSNDEYRLIIYNDSKNRTMTITGFDLYFEGRVPCPGYHTIQVWKIMTWRFFGIAFFGFVFGIGLMVRFEPYPYWIP